MGFALAVGTAVFLVVLGLYIFLKHEDTRAGAVCAVLAAMVFGVWYSGENGKEQLEEELRVAGERIAALEAEPPQRGFSPEVRVAMVTKLSDFVGPTAFVLANAPDRETSEYAREIVSILKDAGWEVPESFGMMYRPVLLPGQERVPPGVILGVTDAVPEYFASAFFNAFREGGVEVSRGPHWPGTEHPISILVGPSR